MTAQQALPVPRFGSDQRVWDWLSYGSYVDVERRYLYVETPKAACSTIKHMLRALATGVPLHFNPREAQSRLAMMIHDRGQMPLPPLTVFSEADRREIMTGDGWFRFCVLRHPYDRFFSAWRDKVFLVEPTFERYLPTDGRKFVEFSTFIDRVLTQEDPYGCDVHWRAQVSLLLPDDIAYTHVYDIGDVFGVRVDLQQHLAKLGRDDRLAPFQRNNEGWSIPLAGFLSAEKQAALRQFYAADFARFPFPEREASTAPPRTAAEFVNQFTDAVFDRNRTISEHVAAAARRG